MGQVLAKMSRLTLPVKVPLPGSRIWKVGSFSEAGLPCRAGQRKLLKKRAQRWD